MRSCLASLILVSFAFHSLADGPGDNLADKVRRVPPPGVDLTAADREELAEGVDKLGREIAVLSQKLAGKPGADLLPDVQIYFNAVRYALVHGEFFKPAEVTV